MNTRTYLGKILARHKSNLKSLVILYTLHNWIITMSTPANTNVIQSPATGEKPKKVYEVVDFPCVHHSFQRPNGELVDKLYNLDINRLIFPKATNKKWGARHVDVKYHLVDEKENIDAVIPLRVQTPVMNIPFGKKDWTNDDDKKKDNKNTKTTFALGFWGKDDDEDLQKFYRVCQLTDERTLDVAVENMNEWWDGLNGLHPDVVKAYYKRLSLSKKINPETNEPYVGVLNLSLKKRGKKVSTGIYDASDPPKRVSSDKLLKGCKVMALIHHKGLWIKSGGFSHVMEAGQIQIVDDTYAEEDYDDDDTCQIVTTGFVNTKKQRVE